MKEDTSTIEVDPDELSEQVVEDLVEEGAFTREDAEECGDDVWFEEIETPDPTKRESVYNKVSARVRGSYSSWRDRSAFINIESVERTDSDRVQLNMFHPNHGEKTLVLSVNSSSLGNLMALAGVDNPKELEGGRVVMIEGSWNRPELVIPENLSFYGRSKYKTYAGISHIQEKTHIKRLDEDSMFEFAMVTLFSWIPALVGALVADFSVILGGIIMLPALILTILFTALIVYGIVRFILFILGALLSGEVSEVKTRR